VNRKSLHREPTAIPPVSLKNTVAGRRFPIPQFEFLGDQILQSDFYYERSFSSTAGNDDSVRSALNFPTSALVAVILFQQIGANFLPALASSIAPTCGNTRFRGAPHALSRWISE